MSHLSISVVLILAITACGNEAGNQSSDLASYQSSERQDEYPLPQTTITTIPADLPKEKCKEIYVCTHRDENRLCTESIIKKDCPKK